MNAPPSIAGHPRFVLWRSEVREGKRTKVPYQAANPQAKASVDSPSTWTDFPTAQEALDKTDCHGLGYVLGNRVAGVDLDGVRDPQTGRIEPWAASVVERLGSYAEVSPSGRGIHILLRGELPPGLNRVNIGQAHIEVYDRGRFFTFTGQHLPHTPLDLQERTPELTALHADLLLLRQFLEWGKRVNAEKIELLLAGKVDGYPSESERDLALAGYLVRWAGGDMRQADRVFRLTRCYRDKWDRSDYRKRTFAKALESRGTAAGVVHCPPAPALPVRDDPSPSLSLIARDSDDDANTTPVELCTLAKPGPRRWIVQGVLPSNTPTILFGGGGIAKSLLGMLVADRVARGQDLFRRTVQQGRVLYLDWELDREEQTRRAYRVAAGLGFPCPAPGLFYNQMALPLNSALPQIERWVRDLQISLTVLDSFGLAALGDPIAAVDVVPLMAAVSRLPCTSLFIDHVRNLQPGENGDNLNPFGSVYKFNIARSVIRVIRVDGDEISLSLLLKQTKSNFGALSEPLGLRVSFEEERISFEQVPLSSLIFAEASDYLPACEKVHRALLAAEEASPQELSKETGLGIGTVKNQLTRLRGQGKAKPVSRGRWKAVGESSSSFPLSDDDDDNPAVGGQ